MKKAKYQVLRNTGIILAIIGYFSLLVCISYLRSGFFQSGPIGFERGPADFVSLDDSNGFNCDSQGISLNNQIENTLSGGYTDINLKGVEEVLIQFSIENKSNETLLTIDLCADGYDQEEQEKQLVIYTGLNNYQFSLPTGENAPDQAKLRFFTFNQTELTISDLSVTSKNKTDASGTVKASAIISASFILAAFICVLISYQVTFTDIFRIIKAWIKKGGKKGFVALFIIILFIPMLLTVLSLITGKRIDTEIKGNFKRLESPEITAESLLNGKAQNEIESYWNETFQPRGMAIKTYNQIRYSLFHEGTRIIGTDGSIFEPIYILSELASTPTYDCSIIENQEAVDKYVDRLNQLSSKLNNIGKKLFVYTTANKASFDREAIPMMYTIQNRKGCTNYISYFRKLYKEGKIQFVYLDSGEILNSINPEWPIFYKTGIHWSRPAEQAISQRMLELIEQTTHKDMPHYILEQLNSKSTPYWRDADVYDLLNVWNGTKDKVYYEYEERAMDGQNNQRINVFLAGGSFAMGLEDAIVSQHIGNVDFIYYEYGAGYEYWRRNKDDSNMKWFYVIEDIDLQTFLDRNDIVILEMNEAVLEEKCRIDPFLDYFEEFLVSYTPLISFTEEISFPWSSQINNDAMEGFYWPEQNSIWSGPQSSVTIKNDEILKNGMEMEIYIPDELRSEKKRYLHIFVNGKQVQTIDLNETGTKTIYLSPSELISNGEYYYITFESDGYFIAEDERMLSFSLLYAGSAQRR